MQSASKVKKKKEFYWLTFIFLSDKRKILAMKLSKESLKKIFGFILKLMNVFAQVFGLTTNDKQS